MDSCKKYGEEPCECLYYCRDYRYIAKADGNPMQKYCYYCLATPRTKKIGHASTWSGSTPKWCPQGRDEQIQPPIKE